MIRKVLAITICVILFATSTVFASEVRPYGDKFDKIVDYVCSVNRLMGAEMDKEGIAQLTENIRLSVLQYASDCRISFDDACAAYLDELYKEIPVSSLSIRSSNSGDIGDTQLPQAQKGDIFFTDNVMPYNHVGIYIDANHIVESMPKDGVRYWDITNIEAYQSPVNNEIGYTSCILRVNTTTTNKTMAANWANNSSRIGKPYDYDFADNKSDTYLENTGTETSPVYVERPETNAFNCSELVWRSYKKSSANIDLDSNGGLGVYPNNIYNSSYTSIVQYW